MNISRLYKGIPLNIQIIHALFAQHFPYIFRNMLRNHDTCDQVAQVLLRSIDEILELLVRSFDESAGLFPGVPSAFGAPPPPHAAAASSPSPSSSSVNGCCRSAPVTYGLSGNAALMLASQLSVVFKSAGNSIRG